MGQKSWLEPTGLYGLLFVVVMLSHAPCLGCLNSSCLLRLVLYCVHPSGLLSQALLFSLSLAFYSSIPWPFVKFA